MSCHASVAGGPAYAAGAAASTRTKRQAARFVIGHTPVSAAARGGGDQRRCGSVQQGGERREGDGGRSGYRGPRPRRRGAHQGLSRAPARAPRRRLRHRPRPSRARRPGTRRRTGVHRLRAHAGAGRHRSGGHRDADVAARADVPGGAGRRAARAVRESRSASASAKARRSPPRHASAASTSPWEKPTSFTRRTRRRGRSSRRARSGRPAQIRQRHGAWLRRAEPAIDTGPAARDWRVHPRRSGGGAYPWIFDHAVHFFASAEYFAPRPADRAKSMPSPARPPRRGGGAPRTTPTSPPRSTFRSSSTASPTRRARGCGCAPSG